MCCALWLCKSVGDVILEGGSMSEFSIVAGLIVCVEDVSTLARFSKELEDDSEMVAAVRFLIEDRMDEIAAEEENS